MTLYEKPRQPDDTTEYFVILTNHHQIREWVDWPAEPTAEMVRKLVEPYVDGKLAHYAVFHHGAWCSLFLDVEGELKKKQLNEVATEIWRDHHLHHYGKPTKSYVLGDAVLFGKLVWREEWD